MTDRDLAKAAIGIAIVSALTAIAAMIIALRKFRMDREQVQPYVRADLMGVATNGSGQETHEIRISVRNRASQGLKIAWVGIKKHRTARLSTAQHSRWVRIRNRLRPPPTIGVIGVGTEDAFSIFVMHPDAKSSETPIVVRVWVTSFAPSVRQWRSHCAEAPRPNR